MSRSFICDVYLNFLRFSGHFDSDTISDVIMSLLDERVQSFNNVRNERLQTGLHVVKIWQF